MKHCVCEIKVLEKNISQPCSRDNLEQLVHEVLNGWDIEAINQFSILVTERVKCERGREVDMLGRKFRRGEIKF